MALTALATDSVDVEPYTGSDDYGNPQYGASVTYSDVRVQDEGELTRDQDGNEVQTNGVLYVMGVDATDDFNAQARVALPGCNSDDCKETVMKSAHKSGLGGAVDHTKVWF